MKSTERQDRTPDPAARVWFSWRHVVLGVVFGAVLFACGGLAIMMIGRLRGDLAELTEEGLRAAELRWQQNRPSDYNLTVELGGARPGTIRLEVRGGRVVTAPTLDGTPIQGRHAWETWTIDGQFGTIYRELELAADPQGQMRLERGARLVLRAEFDSRIGYPRRFRRYVLGHGPEVRWDVTRFEVVNSGD